MDSEEARVLLVDLCLVKADFLAAHGQLYSEIYSMKCQTQSTTGAQVIILPEITFLQMNVTHPMGVPAVFTPPLIM